MSLLRQLHPLTWNIIIGTMFGRLATSMSVPFLAIYLTKVMGVSPSKTGLVIAGSALVGICASFFGGYLSDRFGRKKVLLLSIFLWAAVFVGFGFSSTVIAFFIMNGLNGLCRSTFEPTTRALLADLTEPENRLVIFNLRYTAVNIGVIFGPLIGYVLGSSETTFPFFIAAGMYVLYGLSLVWTFRKAPPVVKPAGNSNKRVTLKEAATVIKDDVILLWSLVGLILAISGYSHFNSTLPQALSNTNEIENGAKIYSYLIALNAVVVVTLQYPLLKIGKKFSPLTSIMLGNLITVISLVGFGFSASVPSWALFVVIFTIGEILMFSMTDLFIDNIAKPHLRGTYFGAMGFTALGNVLGPVIGGAFLSHFGFDQPLIVFGSMALIALSALPIFMIIRVKLRRARVADDSL